MSKTLRAPRAATALALLLTVAPGGSFGGFGDHCAVSCGLALGFGDGVGWAMAGA